MFPPQYKIFFVLYNVAYLAIGTVMVGFGAAAIAAFLSIQTFVPLIFLAAPAIFVAVGMIKILVSIFGGVLAIIKKKPLFAIYVVLSIVLMLGTFAGAITSFLERPSAFSAITTRLNDTYAASSANQAAISNIEGTFDCCGPTRALLSTTSCISGRPQNSVFGQGCLQPISDAVLERLYDLGAIAMAFGSFELTSFLVALQHTEGYGL